MASPQIVMAAALLASVLLPSLARAAPRVAVGVFGFYGQPLQQADSAPGRLVGAKLRAQISGPLGVEVSTSRLRQGDRAFIVPDIPGKQYHPRARETWTSVDAVIEAGGPEGAGLYLSVGIDEALLQRPHRADASRTGWNAGLGLEFRSPLRLAVDAAARLHVTPVAGNGARKTLAWQVGLNWYLFR